MEHENLKVNLIGDPGKTFIKNLTVNVYNFTVKISAKYGNYDFIHYRMFEDVTVRDYTGRLTRYNEHAPDHLLFDYIIFVEPNQAALDKKQVYTVGIVLKNSKTDLIDYDKNDHFIGHTDFFFIGVPEGLVAEAIDRVYDSEFIGVFCFDDGKIHLMPHWINPTVERQKNLLEQVMYSCMFGEDFKGSVSFKLDDIEVKSPTLKENIETGIVNTQESTEGTEEDTDPEYQRLLRIKEEATGALPAVHTDENTLPSYECSVANYNSRVDVRVDDEIKTEQTAARESARIAEAREKEQQRKKKHDAKVAALHKEVSAMNKEVPSVIVSILDRLSLGDQRVYHAIRRYGGIQAQNIAEILPYQECVERPSLATIKRSISALTKAGLIIREGSKKTGQYIITKSIL